MKDKIMASQKKDAQLRQLEEKAYQLKMSGNTLGALEILEKAMEFEKQWYHLYVKACWLYDLPEKNVSASWDAIQEGLSRFPSHHLWFYYIRAQLRYLSVNSQISEECDLQKVIKESVEAQKDIETALELVLAGTDTIKDDIEKNDIENLCSLLPRGWKGADVNDVISRFQNLKNEILSTYRTINLFSIVTETEKDLEKRMENQKQEMTNLELHLEHYRAVNAVNLELGKATNQAGQSALKASIFLNAGSAVAILALLANVWDKTAPDIGLKIIVAVSLFSLGAMLSSISTGFTYLSQYASHKNINLSHKLNLSANGLVFVSYNLFVVGAYLTLVGIGKKFGLEPILIKLLNWLLPVSLILIDFFLVRLIYNVLKFETNSNETDNR